jgi:hypothetical protein
MKKLVFAGLLLLIGSGLVFAETFYTISRNDYRSLMIEIAAVETDIEFARILMKEDEAYCRGKLKAYRYIVEKIEKYETNNFFKQDLNPPLSTPLSIDESLSLINGRIDLIEMKLNNPNETKKRLDKLQEGL